MRLKDNRMRPGSSGSAVPDVRRFTAAVVAALAAWDAAALQSQAQQAAGWMECPPAAERLAEASAELCLLRELLDKTERNLRVFRETSPCVFAACQAGTYRSCRC